MENPSWTSDIKPYTGDFLEGLVKEDYKYVFNKYVSNSSMDIEDFTHRLEIFNSKYGKIQSYKFHNAGSSLAPTREMTGYFIYYRVRTNSGKRFRAVFDVTINEQLNRPFKDKFDSFEIYDRRSTVLSIYLGEKSDKE
jgi:hypothetical protein